jgi:aspartate oxidase
LIRKESRGAHFRTDFPRTLPEWQRHIVFRKNVAG